MILCNINLTYAQKDLKYDSKLLVHIMCGTVLHNA